MAPKSKLFSSGRGDAAQLHRQSFVVAVWTLVSRLLGFARDLLFARRFGISPAYDAWVLAYRLPNLFRRLLGEGAFAAAFVPSMVQRLAENPKGGRELYRGALTLNIAIAVALTLCVLYFADALVPVLTLGTAGPDRGQGNLLALLIRWNFPYLILISAAAVGGAALQATKNFFAPAIGPVMFNICMITMVFFLDDLLGPQDSRAVVGLCWAVLLGGLAHLLILAPALARAGLLVLPLGGLRDPLLGQVLLRTAPALIGVGAAQINVLVGSALAYKTGPGVNSALYYGERIFQLPLGVYALAYATVALPSFAEKIRSGAQGALSREFRSVVRQVLFLLVPASVAMYFFSVLLIQGLFGRGAFDQASILMSAAALSGMALGLPALAVSRLLVQVNYASGITWRPAVASVFSMVVHLILATWWASQYGAFGLGAAQAVAAWFQMSYLYKNLSKTGLESPFKGMLGYLFSILAPTVLALATAWAFSRTAGLWIGTEGWAQLITALGMTASSVTAYLGLSLILKIPEASQLLASFKNRLA